MNGIWGEDFAGDANIAEVYVGHLRRKLGPVFGRRICSDRPRLRISILHAGYAVRNRWRFFRSLRFRITSMAMVAVASVLCIAALVVVQSVKSHLVEQVDRNLMNETTYVQSQLRSRHYPSATTPGGTVGPALPRQWDAAWIEHQSEGHAAPHSGKPGGIDSTAVDHLQQPVRVS